MRVGGGESSVRQTPWVPLTPPTAHSQQAKEGAGGYHEIRSDTEVTPGDSQGGLYKGYIDWGNLNRVGTKVGILLG